MIRVTSYHVSMYQVNAGESWEAAMTAQVNVNLALRFIAGGATPAACLDQLSRALLGLVGVDLYLITETIGAA